MKELTPIEREKRIQELLSDDETALEAIKEERDLPALEIALYRVRATRPDVRSAIIDRIESIKPEKVKETLGNKGRAMMRHGVKRKRELKAL